MAGGKSMNLPPALAPWSRYLNIFPAEISLALGPIVQRLALVLGTPGFQSKESEGEPDGFDGLNRRGTYERLLLSEWMLADEMPDEFMRRAVMGEHLFLHPARSSPVGTRASLALFDAGPSQLGTPRIAHLAALIVLANRADSAGAIFGWGVLQQTEAPLLHEINGSTVSRLIDARSHSEATESDLAAWAAKVATWEQLDGVWLIGGRRLERFKADRRMSRVYVQDKLEPEARRLCVSVCGASNPAAEVTLDLPDDRLSTRLLRDPFDAAVAEIQKLSQSYLPGSNLLFDVSGNKIFVRSATWGVTAFNVPNSPRASTGRPKNYRTRRWEPVVAVGKIGRSVALISAQDHFIKFEFCRQGEKKALNGYYTVYNNKIFYSSPVDNGPALMPCFLLPWGIEAAVLDAAGSLFRLAALQTGADLISGKNVIGMAYLIATDVLAVTVLNSRLVYVGKESPGTSLHIVSVGQTDVQRMPIPFAGTASRAFFGPRTDLAHERFGLLALEQNEFQWVVISATGETVLVRPHGAKVVGVLADSKRGGGPGLVALENDRRTLTLNGRSWRRTILQADAPIDRVAVSTFWPYVAYSTVAGEIVIYSLAHGQNLCRYRGEEPE
jgi:hypothetical protein